MLAEIGFIAVGVPIGYALRKSRLAVYLTQATMRWAIRLLLLFLGIALGANDVLMSQLDSLGARGVTIALASVLGSLLGARLLAPRLHPHTPDRPHPASGETRRA